MNPGIHVIPATEYHADPTPEPSLSSSVAKVLIERSPAHAWLKHPRLGGSVDRSPKTNLQLGTAAHSVVLEGHWGSIEFIDTFNYRTKAARQERDDALDHGLTPLLEKQRDTVESMANEMISSGIFRTDMKREQTLVWREGPAWCRARVDAMEDGLILDLKTTDIPATPERWGRTQLWEYAMQVGFYRIGAMAVGASEQPPDFRFVVQEVKPPYAIGQFEFDSAGLDYAEMIARQAIERWTECITRDEWPAYPDGISVMDTPYWVREQLESQ